MIDDLDEIEKSFSKQNSVNAKDLELQKEFEKLNGNSNDDACFDDDDYEDDDFIDEDDYEEEDDDEEDDDDMFNENNYTMLGTSESNELDELENKFNTSIDNSIKEKIGIDSSVKSYNSEDNLMQEFKNISNKKDIFIEKVKESDDLEEKFKESLMDIKSIKTSSNTNLLKNLIILNIN